jgi:serine/threonine protein kinase
VSKAKIHRLMPDTTFAGRFHVESMIGEGAMGTVYLAKRLADAQVTALKILKPAVAESQLKSTERFAREAKVGDRIGDPNIVEVFDTGFDETTGLHWLAMEYLDGLPLTEYLKSHDPSADLRLRLLAQLFGAIAAAHRAGVIHRDLKPDNLFVVDLESAPTLKVLDFGVAKTLREEMQASQTEGGLGTPLWTAPEQGKGGKHIRPSGDVWALGLLTFYLLTNKMFWFHANDDRSSMLDIAMEMLRSPIPLASARAAELEVADRLPAGLDPWFARCIDRDVDARFEEAGSAWDALQAAFGGGPVPESAPRTEPPKGAVGMATIPPTRRTGSGSRTPIGVVVAIVTVLVVGLAVGAWFML